MPLREKRKYSDPSLPRLSPQISGGTTPSPPSTSSPLEQSRWTPMPSFTIWGEYASTHHAAHWGWTRCSTGPRGGSGGYRPLRPRRLRHKVRYPSRSHYRVAVLHRRWRDYGSTPTLFPSCLRNLIGPDTSLLLLEYVPSGTASFGSASTPISGFGHVSIPPSGLTKGESAPKQKVLFC